jgi:selenocysteine-specific elongation factor
MSAPGKINITIGTAGHIDHGKTALVKLLTGCDTDTLKAEKERGMSIDLGFAPCTVAGLDAGIVDVPGHEHFIKTMVAGATGMDAVIFVVAADDGVMPQTREHLDILTLLGVSHGMTVLTKTDIVSPEHLEERRAEVAEFLRGTFLEGNPLVAISNVTGDGFDEFYGALGEVMRGVSPRSGTGVFRMPVDRAFSPRGVGTVVTGIPVSGRAAVGDEVTLLPEGVSGRINAIQVYGEASETAIAGQCAALNVRRFGHGAIKRGQTIAAPGHFEPGRWFACRLRLLPGARFAVKNGVEARFHTGTAVVSAALYLLSGAKAEPGEEVLVQVRTAERIVAGPGDRFILRGLSPVVTVGGGMIIERLERRLRRTRAGVVEDLAARAEAVGDPARFAAYCVESAGTDGADAETISRRIKATPGETERIIAAFVDGGRARRFGALYVSAEAAEAAERLVVESLGEYHAAAPESAGIREAELAEGAGLSPTVFDGVLAALVEDGRVTRAGGRVAAAGHEAAVPPEERELLRDVEAAFREAPFAPPSVDEIIARTNRDAQAVKKCVGTLLERGAIVRVAEGMFFHADAVAEARRRLEEHIRREGELQSVKFKYLLDTTRKYAIPLLDYFDSVKVTVRAGNTRYLRME